jgi:oxygen-independent coproporphyrinogen-3 oxidase
MAVSSFISDQSYLSVPSHLLRKYDRPGPRYTSYPTVPVWTEDFGAADYHRHLDAFAAGDRGLSVYVHLPFCERRCTFCGCNVVIAQREDTVERYLDYLFREIDLITERFGGKRRLLQLHWGGGTPTHLSIPQMQRVWDKLKSVFVFDPHAEIAIEVDPRVTTSEQMHFLRGLGFNRLSMGVQDLSPDVQYAIGRNQTDKQTEAIYAFGRDVGFTGINMDLIYGLPRQNPYDWQRTMDMIAEWKPDRLAVYSYAHVPWVKPQQMQINEAELPKGPEKFALFEIAVKGLLAAGYEPIGFDHFALPTDELAQGIHNGRLHRNFMGYTVSVSRDMVGLGLSSIGEIGGCFAQNDSRLGGYYRRMDESGTGVHRGWSLSQDDKIRQETILAIMCRMRLSFAELDAKLKVDSRDYFRDEITRLDEFVDDELVEINDDGFAVTPRGRHFVRNVAMIFDAYLPKLQGSATVKKPIFSRTI